MSLQFKQLDLIMKQLNIENSTWIYKIYANKIENMNSKNATSVTQKYCLFLLAEINNEEFMKQKKNCINYLENISLII
jgi:hypothetical protein